MRGADEPAEPGFVGLEADVPELKGKKRGVERGQDEEATQGISDGEPVREPKENGEVARFSFEAHSVRVVVVDDAPWFVLSDVAAVLEFDRSRNAARMLDDDEKGAHIVSTPGGNQEVTIINESGMYSLILKSRKPEAKKFRKWVTSEVLPTLRKKEGRVEQHDLPTGGISLAIASIPIRQDRDGRYCLNDLHKAAGGLSKDRPSKWLDSETTQELVSELCAGKPASEQNQSLKIHKGGDGWQGTFVARELVYAYAMWISPKFHLAVIRAFDALVMGQQPQVGSARTTTPPGDDRIAIDTLLAAKDRSWQLAIEVRDQMLELVGHDMAKLVGPVITAYQEKVQNQIVDGVSSRRWTPTADLPKLAGNWKEVPR